MTWGFLCQFLSSLFSGPVAFVIGAFFGVCLGAAGGMFMAKWS
jgi:hypothetical protein